MVNAENILAPEDGGLSADDWYIAANLSFEEKMRACHLGRAQEYPPIGDQLDALWKGGEAAAEMLAKVQAVKAKYPKPE